MALQLWNPDPHLRAGPAVEESFVLFINGTDRTINLYWIDWTGRQKFYHNLEPRRNIKANTFCSHPWVFRDSVTAERMQVEHQYIFWPQAYRMANQDNEMVPCRKPILIHLPIRKLRETCLWKLGLHLYKNGTTSVERFDNILPGTVKKDLHYVINVIVQNSLHS